LVGTPILTGSLVRIFLGIWSDQYGGRIVYTFTMLAAAVATDAVTSPPLAANVGGVVSDHVFPPSVETLILSVSAVP